MAGYVNDVVRSSHDEDVSVFVDIACVFCVVEAGESAEIGVFEPLGSAPDSR